MQGVERAGKETFFLSLPKHLNLRESSKVDGQQTGDGEMEIFI